MVGLEGITVEKRVIVNIKPENQTVSFSFVTFIQRVCKVLL